MEEEIQLQKDLLKTISVDTRAATLKLLQQRPMTASELSRALDKHVTTISEHLDTLLGSGLVERVERPGRKWIYYKLSKNADKILRPNAYQRWSVVLVVAFMVLVGTFVPFVDANPGEPLYPLDRFVESARLAVTTDENQRAKLHLEFAEERLAEARHAAGKNDKQALQEAGKDYKKELENTQHEISEVRNKGKELIPLLEHTTEATAKHISILENLEKRNPELIPEIQPMLDISVENRQDAKDELDDLIGQIGT